MDDDLFPSVVHRLPGASEPPIWPVSIALFWEMARLDLLTSKDHVYLWRGRLARRPIPSPEHCHALKILYDRFHKFLPDSPHAESRQALTLTREDSVLIPDVSIVRGRWEDRRNDFPAPNEILLIAEAIDLPHEHLLADIYAAEGIPTYWEVSLARRAITVFHEPDGAAYASRRVFGPGEDVPVVVGGRVVGRVGVSEILPWTDLNTLIRSL